MPDGGDSSSSSSRNDDEDIAAGEALLFGLALRGGVLDTKIEHEDSGPSEDDSLGRSDTQPSILTLSQTVPQMVRSLCSFQDNLGALAVEGTFSELFEWATSEGASLGGLTCQKDSFGGRGLFATRDFLENETIAILPRSLRWGLTHACRILDWLPTSTPDLTALSLLVLKLCQDDHVYARCLPRREQFSNAMLFSLEDEELWSRRGDEYAVAIRRVQAIRDGCMGYIQGVLLNDNNTGFNLTLPWAIAMVKSRSHAFGSRGGYWLTPVLDLLNHSLSPSATLKGGTDGQLLLKARQTIQEGSEITIDYQVEDDAMLVATYGFSLLQHATNDEGRTDDA